MERAEHRRRLRELEVGLSARHGPFEPRRSFAQAAHTEPAGELPDPVLAVRHGRGRRRLADFATRPPPESESRNLHVQERPFRAHYAKKPCARQGIVDQPCAAPLVQLEGGFCLELQVCAQVELATKRVGVAAVVAVLVATTTVLKRQRGILIQ